MALHIDIDSGVPVPAKDDLAGHQDLLRNAKAAANAARLLAEHGLDLDLDEEGKAAAAGLATAYARDPIKTSKVATPLQMSSMPPAAVMLTAQILNDFGHEIVKDALKVRHLVMNKLVQETENPDPRIRIRALELLGKITDVGLFTERSEVTVTHRTTDDLKESLRQKLQRLKDVTPPPDAEIIEDD
jgi:broad specificity phosphatase PhoE